jgi:hypothetical protein
MLIEEGTVRYTGDLVRGTLVLEKVGPFMAAFRARYTRNFRLTFSRHASLCPSELPLWSENIFANYFTGAERFYRS